MDELINKIDTLEKKFCRNSNDIELIKTLEKKLEIAIKALEGLKSSRKFRSVEAVTDYINETLEEINERI